MPWDINKERLESHFVRFGRIQRVGLKKNEQTGRPRGFAFVIYSKKEDADACLAERWHKLDNHVVDVKKAIPPSEKNKSVHARVKLLFSPLKINLFDFKCLRTR